MPVSVVKDDKNNYYSKYIPFEKIQMHGYVKSLFLTAKDCIELNGIDGELAVHFEILGRIVTRVDYTFEYFKIYHNTILSELRRAALTAYWVLKYHPYRIVTNTSNNVQINEQIALHMITSTITALHICNNERNESYIAVIPNEFKEKLLYGFNEHEISKEAMMLIVESLYHEI